MLTGARLQDSPVWRVPGRHFSNEALGNPAVDGWPQSWRGRPGRPELPDDMILCDRFRQFKGLERPVIILVEVSTDDAKVLDRLLYVGGSRARQHFVVIGSGRGPSLDFKRSAIESRRSR